MVGAGDEGFCNWGMGEVGCVCELGQSDVPRSAGESDESRCAGLRRSIDTLSVRPFRLMV